MAIMVTVKLSSQSHYDKIANELMKRGFTSLSALSHVCATTEDGFLVVDVWPSRAEWDKFVNDKLQPCIKAAGLTEEPEVNVYEAHNFGWPGKFAKARKEERPRPI